ncbi:MAG: N-acetyl sugar amidotransferase [Bacteroidetes bacterium]|nr:N-acetyl sugar amidotransferase [Bacteroidota bacterium]
MSSYQICSRCVYDTSIEDISFTAEGLCSYCQKYDNLARKYINIPKEEKQKQLNVILSKIKRLGRNQKYDCILGLSGGVDSSYLAWLAKDLGLRPLVVHFDNGWNSELAVKNIENIVTKLNYDLETYVFNWEEFKDLQRAYFKAGVVDIEVPTDYLIFAVLNKLAAKKGIKYILSGYNYATEFGMPKGWNISNKFDNKNLEDIHKRFGKIKLKNFPKFGRYQIFYYQNILGIETVPLLNYIEYVKKDVKHFISKELDWKDYGGKHYESVFTRFYQGYVLVKKFGIDKRRAHWSALICSGQVTQEEALEDLKNSPYDLELQKQDFEYVAKKLDFSQDEFNEILKAKPVPHSLYATENPNDFSWNFFNAVMSFPVRIRRKLRHIGATGKWR